MNPNRTYEFGKQRKQSGLTPQLVQRAQHMAQQEQEGIRGPMKSFRAGSLQLAIWENESVDEQGQVRQYQTVSFERRYKDKNGEWKSTNTLRVNDLPRASLILNKAFEFLTLRETEEEE